MYDAQFFRESLTVPGGFLGWASAFFTQFLHMPWLGSLIWISLLLLSAKLTAKAFSIPDRLASLAWLPAVILIILNVSMGYGIFVMRQFDWFFSPVLGYLFALVPMFAGRRLQQSRTMILFRFLWISGGFMLFGVYALVGALAELVTCIRKTNVASCVITAAMILLIPLILYNLYTTYRLADTLLLGLPHPSLNAWKGRIYTPLYLTMAFIPLSAFIPFKRIAEFKWLGNGIINISFYLLFAATVCLTHYDDLNFRTEIAMSNAIDDWEWQKAVDIFNDAVKSRSKADERLFQSRTDKLKGITDIHTREEIIFKYSEKFYQPTRLMVLYRDLALIKLDKALDMAFTMKDGISKPSSITIVPIVIQAGKQLYLHYGLVNMCYRWCFEDIVEYGISANALKYLTMQAIATNQWNLASKYLDQLDKTLFYKEWADGQRALLGNPGKVSATKPYDHIQKLMCLDETMSNDKMKAELYLLSHFNSLRPAKATPEYDRVALFWAMRSLDGQLFWKSLYYYTQSNQVKSLPRHVQEAALLFNSLHEKQYDLPIDSKIAESYDAFLKYATSHPVRYIEESQYPYEKKFGRTYFFFYNFILDIASY